MHLLITWKQTLHWQNWCIKYVALSTIIWRTWRYIWISSFGCQPVSCLFVHQLCASTLHIVVKPRRERDYVLGWVVAIFLFRLKDGDVPVFIMSSVTKIKLFGCPSIVRSNEVHQCYDHTVFIYLLFCNSRCRCDVFPWSSTMSGLNSSYFQQRSDRVQQGSGSP